MLFCHQGFFATYVRQTNAIAIGAVNTFTIVFVSVFVRYSASKSEKAVNNFPVITGVLRARDSYGNSTRQAIPIPGYTLPWYIIAYHILP